MSLVNSLEARQEALKCLAGVVSAHLANRHFEHEVCCTNGFFYVNLEAQSITDIDIERIIRLVRGFNASLRLEAVDSRLSIALFF